MIFDAMCGIIERHFKNPKVLGWMREARVFRFPGRLHEVAAELTDDERAQFYGKAGGMEFLEEHFFLPFPVIAVEDTATCVVIIDTQPDQKGLNGRRLFLEGQWTDGRNEKEYGAGYSIPAGSRPDEVMISLTEVSEIRASKSGEDGHVDVFGDWIWTLIGTKKGGLSLHPKQSRVFAEATNQRQAHTFGALQNAKAALEEVMFFNTPDRFIVKRSPDSPRERRTKRAPFIPRTNERPSYILLTPQEIHEQLGMGTTSTGRKTPVPHARRRHYRTLRSDRFKNAQGKVIVVKASWVGPTIAEHNGRRYEVCLDL